MISPEDACKFAEQHFPFGPEKLADSLNVVVRESELEGCDGWCITLDDQSIIRINSLQSANRKRFTLAHELSHLILGVPGLIGETFEDMISSDSAEERRVNELASQILMPFGVVKGTLPDLPVVNLGLKRLAKKSKVSELSAAIRVCNSAKKLGILKASVILFDKECVKWQWSRTMQIPEHVAVKLLTATRDEITGTFRYQQDKGDVVVASIIENPYFGSATLFVQLIPKEIGMSVSQPERRKQLETELFENNDKLRHQVSGLMGAHKNRIEGLNLEDAIELFWEKNFAKLEQSNMNSDAGFEYVRLRIFEWY